VRRHAQSEILPVGIPSVSDPQNKHCDFLVTKLVDDPIVAIPNAPKPFELAFEPAPRSRSLCKAINSQNDTTPCSGVQPPQRF